MIGIQRYICIHGHFYQPPRENPWLEEIEIEDTAFPFHDWNERITAECYAPNATSRILDSQRKIIDIVNNYSKISFNFGPTLISWLEKNNPEVYNAILTADKESQKRFSGHGSAIAQVYNHIIMPLANIRDKRTEIIWGIKDFESRFNRYPEGMWLAETAVDYETLEVLAEEGILFTILSPDQAKRVKKLSGDSWKNIIKGDINITRPYLCRLPSGRQISLFFYDKSIANEVAFGNLLDNGEQFAKRMIRAFPESASHPVLLNVANDGETYGHHHRFADMALSFAIHTIESKKLADFTIYGEYLEKFPPEYEVEILENTSWSCSHGVERWRNDCGCRTYRACLISDADTCVTETTPVISPAYDTRKWNQKWRKPLREAMSWLNERLSVLFETEGALLFKSPWDARDEYINVILNRSPEQIEKFLTKNSLHPLSPEETIHALTLLEMEKNALLMNTSCGWFFDEISGIETVQVMMYACRAMQLAREISDIDFEPEYISLLRIAPSNIPDLKDGAHVYIKYVKTAVVDLSRVAFHYAIISLIESYPHEPRINTYTISCEAYKRGEAGILRLATGYATFKSDLTFKESKLNFAALHMGNHNFVGGVGHHISDRAFSEIESDIWDCFSRSDIPAIILSLDRHFESHSYSLWHLFRDEKRKVLYTVLNTTLEDIESEYRQIYLRYFSLIRAMKEMKIKPPQSLEFPIQYTLNTDIRRCLETDEIDFVRLEGAVNEMIHSNYKPDVSILSHIVQKTVMGLMVQLQVNPDNIHHLERINRLFRTIKPLSLKLDLWDSQNQYFLIGSLLCSVMDQKVQTGDIDAENWQLQFVTLGDNLGVRCP